MTTACPICSAAMTPSRTRETCSFWCAIALRERRYAELPPRSADELLHATHHHRVHGLTCEAFEALLARAGRRCELCRTEPKVIGQRRPASGLLVDHDHETGLIRGLLCPRCNAHMRRIDSGERPIDDATAAYLALSTPTPTFTRTEAAP